MKFQSEFQKPYSKQEQISSSQDQSTLKSTINSSRLSDHFNWQKGELLGRGAYGKVYQGLNLDNGELIAIKSVKFSGEKNQIVREINNIKNEISLLRTLDHPNIIQYFHTDIISDKSGVEIILEFMPGGSLRNVLDKFGKFDEKLVKVYLRQILQGLSYLHSNRIIHRDLKCANILVSAEGKVKLSDFGASKKLNYSTLNDNSNKEKLCKSMKGSPYWIAPEVVKQDGHSFAADIWSLGCLTIEMLTGRPPFSEYGSDPNKILQLIKNTQQSPNIPQFLSKDAKSFLELCLRIDPTLRPTSQMLFEHPFIKHDYSSQINESVKSKIIINIKDIVKTDKFNQESNYHNNEQISDQCSDSLKINQYLSKQEQREKIEQLLLQDLQIRATLKNNLNLSLINRM